MAKKESNFKSGKKHANKERKRKEALIRQKNPKNGNLGIKQLIKTKTNTPQEILNKCFKDNVSKQTKTYRWIVNKLAKK